MKLWQGTPDEFLDWLESEDWELVCYGAGAMAEDVLREPRFAEKVRFFVDGSSDKQERSFYGERYQVFAPDRLRTEDLSCTALLITSGWFREIERELSAWPELENVCCAAFPAMLTACTPGSEEFFRRRILEQCLLEYDSALRQRGDTDNNERKRLLAEKRDFLLGPDPAHRPLVLPRVMILPTTRCNLRCKGCSSLLPLFEHPTDIPVEQNTRDLELLFRSIDGCIRVTVGGEPFLSKTLPELLTYLQEQEKVFSVLLITNSTIQPSPEALAILQAPKFYVEVSDYGHIQQMSRTVAALEGAGVRFRVLTEQVWDDMGGVEPRGRDDTQRREVYRNCEQGWLMKSIFNGKMHVCARSARMYALDCGYESAHDYFELREEDGGEKIRAKIRALYDLDFTDACDRCDLGRLPNKKIPAGVQMAGNMKKSAYTLVRRDEYEALKRAAGKNQ